jgi:type IV pilus assembly protein PilY1
MITNNSDRPSNTAMLRERPLWAKALAVLVIQTLVLQPATVFAASTLSQRPMFAVGSQPANVMLLMDDSASMMSYRLEPPPGLTEPTGTVAVKYYTTTKNVSATNEFMLRSPAFNPLWYNPTMTYRPWNDNNKPAATASFPKATENLPNADYGGSTNVADMTKVTQRDMRFRGVSGTDRQWVSQARGAVGQGINTATSAVWWVAGITATSKWTWNSTASPTRWELTLSTPTAGLAVYPPIPEEGAQGADLFTNSGDPVCTVGPPCVEWNYKSVFDFCAEWNTKEVNDTCKTYGKKTVNDTCAEWNKKTVNTTCAVYNKKPGGTCIEYNKDKPVYGPTCTEYNKKSVTDFDNCLVWNWLPGTICTAWSQKDETTCELVEDPTAESGFKQVCTTKKVNDACIAWSDPVKGTCKTYGTKLVDDTCKTFETIGWTDGTCKTWDSLVDDLTSCATWNTAEVNDTCKIWNTKEVDDLANCLEWNKKTVNDTCKTPVYKDVQDTCKTYDPGWTCPADKWTYTGVTLVPARYYRYEGPDMTAAERSKPSNYRMIEINREKSWKSGARDNTDPALQFPVVDPITGAASSRTDCAAGSWCTFDEEAQNFANWYAYYRNRLFTAVAVSSQALSDMNDNSQYLRIGFGRINNQRGAAKPWDPTNLANRVSDPLPTIDGGTNWGAVERGVRTFEIGLPYRQEVFDWLFQLNWTGSTPNREALYGVGRYFARTDNQSPWAMFPQTGEKPEDNLWCRRNFTLLATDGEWTKVNPAVAKKPQPRMEDAYYAAELDPVAVGGVTSTVLTALGSAGPKQDGEDPKVGTKYGPYTYDPATETWFGGGKSDQGNTLSDIAFYFWSRDLRPEVAMKNGLKPDGRDAAFWQHMSTYIVGYGVSATEEAVARAAIAGKAAMAWPQVGMEDCRIVDENAAAENKAVGCTVFDAGVTYGNRINDTMRAALVSGGEFYAAADANKLRQGILESLASFLKDPSAGVAPSISSSYVTPTGMVVQATFRTDVWDGEVMAFDSVKLLGALKAKTDPMATALKWKTTFPSWDKRAIFTSTAVNTGVPFLWAKIDASQQALLGKSELLDYIRGDISNELRSADGDGKNIYRNRRDTILGTVVNSSPLFSNDTAFAYQLSPAASYFDTSDQTKNGAPWYTDYVKKKASTRVPMIAFGANDGMFHALNASTGAEMFAFVPRATYSKLKDFADPAYLHFYTVDGPVVEGDVWSGGVWKTIAVGSTGAGPAGLFALDVTEPDKFDETKVLWDIVPSESADADIKKHLGNVLQPGYLGSIRWDKDYPKPATLPNGEWVYIVGNGYESVEEDAALLIFNALDGSLIKAISTGDDTGNGLGAITPVFDGNRNVIGVYAGDRKGKVWKFDLSSSNKADWKVANHADGDPTTPVPLFTAKDSTNKAQPITSPPRVTLHPHGGFWVAVGTGKLFDVGDPLDKNVQSLYVFRDNGVAEVKTGKDLNRSSLLSLTLEEVTVGANFFRNIKAADFTKLKSNTLPGFFFDLIADKKSADGERIIAPMVMDAGVLSLSTFSPTSSGDPCTPGGVSQLCRIDLAGGFTQSGFSGQGADSVCIRVDPGTVGGLVPLYEAAAVSGSTVHTMTQDEIETMMAKPKYKQASATDVAKQQGATGTCTHVGLKVDGTLAGIPTQCSGVMPIRSWRPMR